MPEYSCISMHLHNLYNVIQCTILQLFQGENSYKWLIPTFQVGNFMNHQYHLVIKVFSKHFEGKFHKWQLIHEIHENFPLKNPQYYNTSLLIYLSHHPK